LPLRRRGASDTAPTPTGCAQIVCNYFPVPNRHEGESARKREQLLIEKSFSRTDRLIRRGAVKRASLALLASFVVALALGESPEPTKVRITTWNLEWFPNGSAHDAAPEIQAQRIKAAADVLRPINADIILLQEVRDYEACVRLGEAIAPGMYHVAICSAFKEPVQSGLGKQQVAIPSKYQAQAAWAEAWKSLNGVDPPRGFAFAWFKRCLTSPPARYKQNSAQQDSAFGVRCVFPSLSLNGGQKPREDADAVPKSSDCWMRRASPFGHHQSKNFKNMLTCFFRLT